MDQIEAAQRDFLDASGAGMPTRREASHCCRFAAMQGCDSRRLLPGLDRQYEADEPRLSHFQKALVED
jgi:hypothetical protein